jgi:hypothetical protein
MECADGWCVRHVFNTACQRLPHEVKNGSTLACGVMSNEREDLFKECLA